ncbi:hypothetical protein FA09DRAFT_146007 [Tilletiopsis washingtonensis]|uniref:Uncharacterized protein n=1 Tax=Tilletiopsis washingtonensis TaxID=58919 RepID=A0A316Z154_9BASI|nr:hypothetical protein FA09DRAFT_146007 [Tilletiopsis washingtonensis]PWN95289.1 hypothetical protein FA09DRAFT_146007 [Tilletiopsis washingtonensis]
MQPCRCRRVAAAVAAARYDGLHSRGEELASLPLAVAPIRLPDAAPPRCMLHTPGGPIGPPLRGCSTRHAGGCLALQRTICGRALSDRRAREDVREGSV